MTEFKIEDYVNYRMQRAKETLAEVQTLIDNKYWNTSINRMYYSTFYAVNALLIKNGIKASSHSGVSRKFGELFVKTSIIEKYLAKHYADLFEKRCKGDYNDFFEFDEETALRLFPLTKEFVLKIEELLR